MQIASKQKTSGTEFLYSILEFSIQANVAHDESCLCMPCRIAHLRHYESLQLWELWNLFKESLPKATSNALDKAYLATMKCVVVSKVFKKVPEEQTTTTKVTIKYDLYYKNQFLLRSNCVLFDIQKACIVKTHGICAIYMFLKLCYEYGNH